MKTTELTQARLRNLVGYDPLTGQFVRLRTTSSSAVAGSVAGNPCEQGYVHFWVDGRRYAAHRLAWLYVYGVWPVGIIDHINGQPSDNRIANLRDVNATINRQNQTVPRSDNLSSGVIGVAWSAYHNKWKAHIRTDGQLKHLKYCDSIEEARSVYLEAKRRLHAGFVDPALHASARSNQAPNRGAAA